MSTLSDLATPNGGESAPSCGSLPNSGVSALGDLGTSSGGTSALEIFLESVLLGALQELLEPVAEPRQFRGTLP